MKYLLKENQLTRVMDDLSFSNNIFTMNNSFCSIALYYDRCYKIIIGIT